MKPELRQPIPIWGGFECTVARVRDEYRDQLRETGHMERPQDLDLVAGMGIKTLRHGVLWEHVYPDAAERPVWAPQDERLRGLRDRGIVPIVGLLHHGSGPRHTNLLDPRFPSLFADYAGQVAARYPWLRTFTPINEPLTTARFSCLYGHWYPHRRNQRSFLRALFNQVRATAMAMERIREVIPNAEFIQTEDIGKVFSRPRLRYQAEYENQRRWLSLDLLSGRIGPRHPWHRAFLDAGLGEEALADLSDRPCPPDIIGINHYLSSDRFLDDRHRLYGPAALGGNGRHIYADIEANRLKSSAGTLGVGARIDEVWSRYGLPIAITEVHNGCSREEQLRWLIEAMKAAVAARDAGVDVRALTVWALAGLIDWDSLLTRCNGHYESGPLEGRDAPVRKTALAQAVESLVKTNAFDHPVLDAPGWWQRGDRHGAKARSFAVRPQGARRLLIAGGNGTLGQAFSRICLGRGLPHDLTNRADFDNSDAKAVHRALSERRPWAVVNAGGSTSVAEAERDPERCRRENSLGPEILATVCADLAIPLLTFSSDIVFDGLLGRPYVEGDRPRPMGVLATSKADAEERVMRCWDKALIVRSGEFFGPWDGGSFLSQVLATLQAGGECAIMDEARLTPAYLPDVVHRALDLLIDGERGIWHLANQGGISRGKFARGAALRAGLSPRVIVLNEPVGTSKELASERGPLLPPLASALDRFFLERRPL